MKSFRLAPDRCPACGLAIDAASNTWNNRKPKPGDATMCIQCGAWAIFDPHMKLRPPTLAEFLQLSNDDKVQQMGVAHNRLLTDRGGRKQ